MKGFDQYTKYDVVAVNVPIRSPMITSSLWCLWERLSNNLKMNG